MITSKQLLEELERYEKDVEAILSRFSPKYDVNPDDAPKLRLIVNELIDLLNDALGRRNRYSVQIGNDYNTGQANFYNSPSYVSVEAILMAIHAAKTRIARNPDLIDKRETPSNRQRKENIFLIHGRDEAKRRELKEILKSDLGLNPVVLVDEPDHGCKTVVEKFEYYAPTCSYAIALFTPDDEVSASGETYLQAPPNVIYEIGWFCGAFSRESVMLLLKEGTQMFSDFGGIIQKRFARDVSEKTSEIRRELVGAGIITE